MRHSANLDILRSFAVSVVMIDHLVLTLVAHAGFHNEPIIAFTRSIGYAGVLAFFVHTSLVLMYSLERMTRDGSRVTLRFYIRRFFRIYPLSIVCVVGAVVLHIPNYAWRDPEKISIAVVAANLLLVQNIFTKVSVISPLWTLPYEVQMYLALPALYFLVRKRGGVGYLCGILAAVCCAGLIIASKSSGGNKAAYVPCFLCGVLCYGLRNRVRKFIPAMIWPSFLALLIAGYCIANLHERPPSMVVGWVFCLILGLTANAFQESAIKPLNLTAEKIALYSYGMYLIHVPVLYLVFIVMGVHNQILGSSWFFILTAIGSMMAYKAIESPLIEIGRRLSLPREARADVALPSAVE